MDWSIPALATCSDGDANAHGLSDGLSHSHVDFNPNTDRYSNQHASPAAFSSFYTSAHPYGEPPAVLYFEPV
jgi:hypothetical protein